MLRKALGDDAQKPRFIETVSRRGYRFIVEVRKVQSIDAETSRRADEVRITNLSADSAASFRSASASPRLPVAVSQKGAFVALADRRSATDPAQPEPATPAAKLELVQPKPAITDKSKYLVFIAAALVIGAIGFASYFYSSEKTLGADQTKTIAVLPIRPINSTIRDEDYEIGIADSLINRINSMKGLLARPLNSTRKYTDIGQDSVVAGREQKVDYVLASTYQVAGGKIRIASQLLNVASGKIEETYTTEKDTGDIFSMQDAIASEIGNRLMVQFATTPVGPVAKRGTDNEDAYRLYLQGMYLYDRRTLADAENALDKLERATQLDPNYAKAWAGKAHVHRSLGYFSVNRNIHEDYTQSIDAINRALTLDENLGDAYSALCENKFFYEYDFEGAERECKRAIELDPNSFLAHEIYSRCLWTLNRFDEAITEIKIAIDLQPTSLFSQRNYGISLFYARRSSEAVQQFKRVAEVDPNFIANYAWFVPALIVHGREAEAFEWFIKWQTLLKADEETIQEYKKAYLASGWQGVGRVRVKRFDESKVRSYFLEACLIVHTGNKEKAFEYLEKSFQRREWGIPFLRIDPSLDSIRNDPRFHDLVRRVELK